MFKSNALVKFNCLNDFNASDYNITLDANGNFTANTDISSTQKAISNGSGTFDKDGDVYLIKTAAELRTFDGNGKTISGVQIYSETNETRGLFRSIGLKGVVKNLTLSDSRITAFGFAGGIVAWNNSTVENCRVTETVTIAASKPIVVTHGGIVGYNNYATVTNNTTNAGAIVGDGN